MKFPVFLLTVLFVVAPFGVSHAGVDPSSATWTLYKVNLYESGDCTGTAVTVLDESAGSTQDFTTNPTFATTAISNGTYNCVALKMSDEVSFVPSADSGPQCVAGTTYTTNVCQSGISGTDAETGSTTTCTDSADTVWVYISTYSTSTTGSQSNNPFAPPTSSSDAVNGINLASALTVSGDTTGTFVIDTTGLVDTYNSGANGAAECGFDQPTFSFQ